MECGHGHSKQPHQVLDYRPEDTIQDESQPSSLAAIKEIFLIESLVAGVSMISHLPQGKGATHHCCLG
jgi:hypothetical protein